MAAWIEREAKVGRVYTCASRTIGGYPFRIETRCADPTVELRGRHRAGRHQGAANPGGGAGLPAQSDDRRGDRPDDGRGAGRGSSTDGRLVVAAGERTRAAVGVERVSLVVQGPKLQRTGGASPEPIDAGRTHRIPCAAKRRRESGKPAYDLAARVAAALVPACRRWLARPLNAEATAVLSGLSDLAPKPIAAGCGNGRRRRPVGDHGDPAAAGRRSRGRQGRPGLSPRGRLDGALTITAAGFDELSRWLGLPTPGQGGRQAGILAGLAILGGQTELEGKRAITMPLRFSDGTVFLRPVAAGANRATVLRGPSVGRHTGRQMPICTRLETPEQEAS